MFNIRMSCVTVFPLSRLPRLNQELLNIAFWRGEKGIRIFNSLNSVRLFLPSFSTRQLLCLRQTLLLRFFRKNSCAQAFLAFFTAFRTTFRSMIFGSRRKIWLKGIGLRFDLLPQNVLRLSIGFSHFVTISLPPFGMVVTITAEKGQSVELCGTNNGALGTAAIRLASLRYPSVYTGKGIVTTSLLPFLRRKLGKRTVA